MGWYRPVIATGVVLASVVLVAGCTKPPPTADSPPVSPSNARPDTADETAAAAALRELDFDRNLQVDDTLPGKPIVGVILTHEVNEAHIHGLAREKVIGALQGERIGDVVFTKLYMKELKQLKSLRLLDLTSTRIGDVSVKELTALLTLKELRLDRTAVSDAGLKHLKVLTGLERLGLGGTGVTDTGLKELASLTNLRELSVGHNLITDVGLNELSTLKSLKKLYLSGPQVHVTDAGVKELQSALPELQVIR